MPYLTNILEPSAGLLSSSWNRAADGCGMLILANLENLNPCGNLKDRIALPMIEDAKRKGVVHPGGTIIKPSSGNTGISLAIAAVVKGHRCIFAVPDSAS